MSDILFLTLDDPAGPPADDYAAAGALPWSDARTHAADADAAFDDAERAARETHAGCAAARAGDWAMAAEFLSASAHRRGALVASGRALPAAAVRGWSDAAVLAAAQDDALGAADALARARALCGDDTPGPLLAALHDVTAWLGALGGAPVPAMPAPGAERRAGDLAADFATALVVEPLVAKSPALYPQSTPISDVAADVWADVTPEMAPEFAGVLPDVPVSWDPLDPWTEPAQSGPSADDAPEDVLDGLVFLHVDEAPAAPVAAGVTELAPPTPLAYLDLEGPVRPWERTHAADVPSAVTAPAPLPHPGRAPLAGPLAGPLAPALRNAKIDEAVALATTPSVQAPGRLRTLLDRLRGK